MNPPELIIFDWDGTLYNSVGQIVTSLKYAATQYGQSLTDDDAKSIIGLGLPEVMQTLFPDVPHLQQDILISYSEHYVAHSGQDAWFDGIAELLHDLKVRGFKLAVATGKSRKGLDRVLSHTQSHGLFDITRAASETMSKPHPKMLQEILQETGMKVENALMVGDSSYDLEMAKNIGMPRVGVSYGVHGIEILQRYQPLTIAHDVAGLHAFLIQYLSSKARDLA